MVQWRLNLDRFKYYHPLHACMAQDVPAILRDHSSEDRDTTVLSTPYDGVSFRRGWGDSGYRVEVVEHECPECGFDRMVRRHDVHAESPDVVRYYCLNPNCLYFVSDNLSHAMNGNYPQRQANTPAVVNERSE